MTNGQPETMLSAGCIRFCWLRETAPGHLEHDGALPIAKSDLMAALLGIHPAQQRTASGPGVTTQQALDAVSDITDVDDLPTWARRRLAALLGPLASKEQRVEAARNARVIDDLADRILEAVGDANDIEVHLPYLARRTWASRFETLGKAQFVLQEGRVVPRSLLEPGALDEYNAQWLAVASVDPVTTLKIAFKHTHSLPTALLRSMLPVTADVTLPASGRCTAEVTQTLSPTACRAWNSAPRETSAGYYEAHSEASMAMQSAIRRWFAFHWFSDMGRFDNVYDTYTVLAYMVSRPFPGHRRTDFTYDILANDWAYRAFQFSRRPLKEALKAIFNAIKATGNIKLALRYQPEQARFIIERARKTPRTIAGMLAAEGMVVNHMLKFGVELRAATDPFTVANLAPDYAKGLGSRLRRIFREQDLSYLTTAVMMEATNALWTAMGGQPAIATTVQTSAAEPPAVPLSPAA